MLIFWYDLRKPHLTVLVVLVQGDILTAWCDVRGGANAVDALKVRRERDFLLICNLLAQVHFLTEMSERTGLAPWRFLFSWEPYIHHPG